MGSTACGFLPEVGRRPATAGLTIRPRRQLRGVGGAQGLARLPISRPTTLVSYGDDLDAAFENSIDEIEGKL